MVQWCLLCFHKSNESGASPRTPNVALRLANPTQPKQTKKQKNIYTKPVILFTVCHRRPSRRQLKQTRTSVIWSTHGAESHSPSPKFYCVPPTSITSPTQANPHLGNLEHTRSRVAHRPVARKRRGADGSRSTPRGAPVSSVRHLAKLNISPMQQHPCAASESTRRNS